MSLKAIQYQYLDVSILKKNYKLCLNLFTLNVGIMEIHLLRYCFDCFSAGVLGIITMCMCVCLIISFGFCRAGHVF